MGNYFQAANILLPRECDYEKWAVIACDQHTSEPEYWEQVRAYIGQAPSTLDMFFPEAELGQLSADSFVKFSGAMRGYLTSDFFHEFKDSYIYIERTLTNGSIRQGILGAIDLEFYDFVPKANTKVFATEATVLQRVPPRVNLRKIADLEFSHTVIFCDDPDHSLIEPVGRMRDSLQRIYDFDLMTGGGHISGYLMDGDITQKFNEVISKYEADHAYLVGDGNHSLVTAKLTYEAIKGADPNADWESHPARYAMVELENIHSDSMVFEPIYRIAVSNQSGGLLEELKALHTEDGVPIVCLHGNEEYCIRLKAEDGELPIQALQRVLEQWSEAYGVTVDYIHGADTVRKLARRENTVGFLLPDFDKSVLFPYILSGKVMPKKTFSIGRAEEKRYYLEGRIIR